MITATDTTSGTYCLHDSVSDDTSMEEDNSGNRFNFVSIADDRA